MGRAKIIEYKGEARTMAEWAIARSLKFSTLHARFRAGWSVEEALGFVPRERFKQMIEHNGVRRSIADWAKDSEITNQALRSRLHAGWDVEKALKTPTARESSLPCPRCNSTDTRKAGMRRGKQLHRCMECRRRWSVEISNKEAQ